MNSYLDNGSIYTGEQNTSTGPFKINMKIEFIDIKQSFMCGTFKIFNLTSYHDVINTYYECEIIKEFNNQEELIHWSTFDAYKEIKGKYNLDKSNYLFMKIRELFLLPDPSVKNIPGASIDGYYYCVYDKTEDSFNGFYYYETLRNQPPQKITLHRNFSFFSGKGEFS